MIFSTLFAFCKTFSDFEDLHQVGGEDDNGVLEVHGSALTVGNPAVVQYLE